MNKAERELRKAMLITQVHQQRLDLASSRRDWLEATGSYDRGWHTLLGLRSWLLVGSSIGAIWTIKNPNFLLRWGKRGFAAWSAWKLLKNTMKDQSR
ncbi:MULTISPECIES: YqjK-like family protein [Atlantibacter]|uniref:YqjK-like family protein n=1 Tax=Atlantibacter TaxID=1903434 RepID=UPI0016060DE8|nr:MULTISPECIES: YqjK-like family protein [Atlantibacter]MBB3321855.1 hypothetical protein [Atlantibacter sp. RC6]MBL7634799.1 YqjK-like family protein [Atlantibacter hermannii]MBL7676452.1 YqjK-like family protein [Atlantibacter hermannii]MCZ7833038.1 YqjK-like family protein [Atlantibacter hermannii]